PDLDEDPDAPAVEMSDAALARDPAVRSAFDHLRASANVRLRASGTLRVEPVAMIEGRVRGGAGGAGGGCAPPGSAPAPPPPSSSPPVLIFRRWHGWRQRAARCRH